VFEDECFFLAIPNKVYAPSPRRAADARAVSTAKGKRM
jgi:hypothetical protein